MVFYTFSLVANIISAPFNGLLAEKVEVHLGGRLPEQTSDWRKLLREFIPVMANELRKLLYIVITSYSIHYTKLYECSSGASATITGSGSGSTSGSGSGSG